MTRLIDADALLEEIIEKITRLYGYEKRAIENLITNAPTVQREEQRVYLEHGFVCVRTETGKLLASKKIADFGETDFIAAPTDTE